MISQVTHFLLVQMIDSEQAREEIRKSRLEVARKEY